MYYVKKYIEVEAHYDALGNITPLQIVWEDGRSFPVDRVLDVRRAASRKIGGGGLRFTVRILGQQRYLFFDENRWFVEGKSEQMEGL